jgi:hypothetical protein
MIYPLLMPTIQTESSRPDLVSERQMPAIAVSEAIESIKAFNENPANPVADWIVAEHFGEGYDSASEERAAGRVHALDLMFSADLRFHPRDRLRIIDRLRQKAADIRVYLENLREGDLLKRPTHVATVADRLFEIIGNRADGDNAEHAVFVSKYLHWCTRVHFPIMDSKARSTLNALGLTGRTLQTTRQGYPDWIATCGKLIQEWTDDEWDDLMAVDKRTLPPSYGLNNSRLRLLDKVLYQMGKDSNEQA